MCPGVPTRLKSPEFKAASKHPRQGTTLAIDSVNRALTILLCGAASILLVGMDSSRLDVTENDAAAALWTAHVQPLLSQHCFKCHGELKQKNGLDLSSPAALLKGGDSGPAAVPGRPEESLIYKSVLPGAEQHMPPKDSQLSGDEIALVKMWIAALPSTGSSTPASTNTAREWNASDYRLVKPNAPRKLPPARLTPSQAIDFYIEQERGCLGR